MTMTDAEQWQGKQLRRLQRQQLAALTNVARKAAQEPCPDGAPNTNIICDCVGCTARAVLGTIEGRRKMDKRRSL